MLDVVKHLGKQFHILGTCPAEQGVIDDKHVAPVFIGKRYNFLNYSFTKLQIEFPSVDTTGIHETIKGIFGKRNNR